MTATTRDQFLAAAEHLFAEKGFYGASIATIAQELGLTKQALLHHFGSKEKLYGEVLRAISEKLAADVEKSRESFTTPAEQFEEMLVRQLNGYLKDQDSARLIMRELLDNEQRAEKAGNWYLKGYLEELVAMGRKHRIPVMEDLGSGTFVDFSKYGVIKEPTVQESIAAGLDVVTFSGDKLLGGPQAGIIAGSKEILDRIKRQCLNVRGCS